ncbi:VOC family protein [Mycobacterium yunnanensis]|uniref:VOC family protein n=1 Tax=Mycobacterium yunnanensis TaxID=368477 RepID=A0A9X2Z029_9MYCO|nr:VOC family protein [Mycobacterium yunnanensis]MCV7420551.1 VOC family protein [Mycobacterium yunnanensis]
MASDDDTWVSAFLTFTDDDYDAGLTLWNELTGYSLSVDGGFLSARRLNSGPSGVHLGVHVPDVGTAVGEVRRLGGSIDEGDERLVGRSPGGLPFQLVDDRKPDTSAPSQWPGAHTSMVDQISIDIPQEHWNSESTFWSTLTGWETQTIPGLDEYAFLIRPPGAPLRIILQRLGEPTGSVRAHIDWAVSDRAAETERHVAAGARVLQVNPIWTVLDGVLTYCVTDRNPATGLHYEK